MLLDCGACVVRTARPSDATELPAIANDWEVARFLRDRFPHPYTIDDARWWVERNTSDESTHFMIEANGEVAGGIGYILGSAEERLSAEIGYWLGRRFWGRGLATAACRALTEYVLETNPGVVRIESHVFGNNLASMRVLEKCGYAREGLMRRAVVKGGEILDVAVYARLRA